MPTRAVATGFIAMPEHRSALMALRNILHGEECPNPLFIHGVSGCGKTCLLETLTRELSASGVELCVLSANDFAERDEFTHAATTDLLIVEDLQHLPTRFVDTLIQLIDVRRSQAAPLIFTALHGPAELTHRGKALPRRLTNRLAAGLVVAINPPQASSRRQLLETFAARARMALTPDVLDWLAMNLNGGGRHLAGAVAQLKTLRRLHSKPLPLTEVRKHFHVQTSEVQRIANHVSAFFHVKPARVISAQRSRAVLAPRHVSMYLARQLTHLSLQKIGQYFGGRDHKAVNHACKKVEGALRTNAALAGAVRQLVATLGPGKTC